MENNLTVNEQHELRVLELVEERDKVTQRGVAAELEIAIGMANSLVKRLVQKGYIKIKDAPSSRYGYYLTPEGFLAKSRLVSKYIANSIKFFGEVRRDYEAIAVQVSSSKRRSVGCIGTGEVLEIAQMVFHTHNIKISFVLDVLGHTESEHLKSYAEVPKIDKSKIDYLVITETQRPHRAFEIVASSDCEKHILAPAFMKITKAGFQSKSGRGAGL